MKKICGCLIILCVCLICFTIAQADVAIDGTNFPDPHFRKIVSTYDKNSDGSLSDEELESATYISCYEQSIISIKGIEYFTSLISLDCSYNLITSIDLSHNLHLKDLTCYWNKIQQLDLSQHVELEQLTCFGDDLKSLDLSNCVKLTSLHCGGNIELANLTLGDKPSLNSIVCYSGKIKELNLKGCPELTSLDCRGNEIGVLDLSNNKNLIHLDCSNNKIRTIDVKKNSELLSLSCYGNKLSRLDISANTKLMDLNCANTDLDELDVSKNEQLKLLRCFDNNIHQIDVSNCESLCYFVENVERTYKEDYDCHTDNFTFDSKTTVIAGNITSKPLYHGIKIENDGNGEAYASSDEGYRGEKITLTAKPNKDYLFSEWQIIDGDIYIEDDQFKMGTGNVEIKAIFKPKEKYTVSITTYGSGSANASVDKGTEGTVVELSAKPDQDYRFVNWEVKYGGVVITDNQFTIGNTDVIIAANFEYIDKIKDFVTRCYQLILGREPDADGLQGWCQSLKDKTAAAANIIDGFVKSDEFKNRNLSAGESVDILYNTMLNRAADEGGKAGWVDALGKGYTLQNIIDGFCGSPEFVGLCKDYGIEPGSVNAPAPADMSTPRGKIEAFVKRCYSLILSRDADQGGLQGWSDALESGAGQACQIIDGFVRSEEYVNRKLDHGASVDILYKTMLNREPDPDGRAGWVDALGQGYTLQHIINGFCGSAEFTAICNDYGITAGTLSVASALVKREAITPEGEEAAPVVVGEYRSEFINEEKIKDFVEHCYKAVFGREGDTEGIENYTRAILDGKKSPRKLAYEFIFSPEFQNNLPGNQDFIRILYRLYFDREPGAEELAGWLQMLEGGTSLEEIVNGFAGSAEFKAIVNSMK